MLHKALNLGSRDIVRVHLDKAANVMLLSEVNFQNYRAGRSFEYYGGSARRTIVDLSVPRSGRWYLVIDGFVSTLKYSVQVI